MFGKRTRPTPQEPPAREEPPAAPPDEGLQGALDTLVSVLRSLADHAQDGEKADAATIRKEAEGWAQHVAIAAPPPGAGPDAAVPASGRRDWHGVRRFVRDYASSTARRAASVTADLRDTIWVFIHHFGEALAHDAESDERLRTRVKRLETLFSAAEPSALKREVLDTVGTITAVLDERRARQHARMASLGETVRALGDELETARREGETDPLTRLHNRKAFDAHLERCVEMYQAFGQDACLIMVDVDHFKGVNDRHGHAVGDEALQSVANALAKVFLRKDDFVARFGGDEFAVILRETAVDHVPALGERLLAKVRELKVLAGEEPLSLSVTLGAGALEPGDDARTWFGRADRALYEAKSAGRDRLVLARGPGPAGP